MTTLSSKIDRLTVLATTGSGCSATKRYRMNPQCVVEKIAYGAGTFFDTFAVEVDNIEELSAALQYIENRPDLFVIRGSLKGASHRAAHVQRLKDVVFTTPVEGKHWVLIDFDDIPMPPRLTLSASVGAVCEHLISMLPPEFHNASYHWQLSASAGMGDPSLVSMHLWFWLTSLVTDDALKAWGKAVNDQLGFGLIDTKLFNDNQIHYTAAPIFEDGIVDPFLVRSGFCKKARDSVDLVLLQLQQRPHAAGNNGQGISSSGGFENILQTIGDHPGGDGFHGPIIRAAASYLSTHGTAGTDAEALFEAIRQAVLAADASNHDAGYVAEQASRKVIMSAIESAIPKFGDKPVSQPRLHDGLEPHYQADDVSQSAGNLSDLISRWC